MFHQNKDKSRDEIIILKKLKKLLTNTEEIEANKSEIFFTFMMLFEGTQNNKKLKNGVDELLLKVNLSIYHTLILKTVITKRLEVVNLMDFGIQEKEFKIELEKFCKLVENHQTKKASVDINKLYELLKEFPLREFKIKEMISNLYDQDSPEMIQLRHLQVMQVNIINEFEKLFKIKPILERNRESVKKNLLLSSSPTSSRRSKKFASDLYMMQPSVSEQLKTLIAEKDLNDLKDCFQKLFDLLNHSSSLIQQGVNIHDFFTIFDELMKTKAQRRTW